MSRRLVVTADSLNALDLFRGLPAAERAVIAARLRGAQHPAGHPIVTQHAAQNEVYFILSGSVRAAFHGFSGKDVQFRDLHAGTMFGELAAIDGRRRSAEVVTLSEVSLAVARAADFLDIAAGYPAVARRVFRHLADLVRSLSERVVEFSTLGVNNRIHGELLRLARGFGIAANQAVIQPAPTHGDIASRVSTHREAVTREIAALARAGVLERRRGTLVIRDVARLEQLVGTVSRR